MAYASPEKTRFSADEMDAVEDHKIDADQAIAINQKKGDIRQQIQLATEFTLKEKAVFTEKLSSIQSTSISAIQDFERQVTSQQTSVRKNIEAYVGIINQHREVFAYDPSRGVDAANEYIQEFMLQSAEVKSRWLQELQNDIKGRITLFERIKALTPNKIEYARTLRRHELKAFIAEVEMSSKNITRVEEVFKKNAGLFAPSEIQKLQSEMADTTRNEQAQMLEKIQSEVKARKELHTMYGKLPKNYQAMAGNWEKMEHADRINTMKEIDEQIMADYHKAQVTHPKTKQISPSGKIAGLNFIKTLPTDQKAKALQMLDGMFDYEEKFGITYETLLKKASESLPPNEINSLRIAFYGALDSEKKDTLIPQLEKRLEKIGEEAKEKEALAVNYGKQVDKALGNKYITGERVEKLKKWIKEQPLEIRKEAVSGGFEEWLAPRKAVVERFRDLPQKVQKEQESFYALQYHKRLEMVAELEKRFGKAPDASKDASSAADTEETTNAASAPKEAATSSGKVEVSEQLLEGKIDTLTGQATRAERWKNWQLAEKLYLEILELDPKDELAAERLVAVRQQLAPQGEPAQAKPVDAKTPTDADEKLKAEAQIESSIQKAMGEQKIRKERRNYATLSRISEQTDKAERDHGNKKIAAQRLGDVQAKHKNLAEQLAKHTDRVVMGSDGKVENVLKVKADFDQHTEEDKRWRRWSATVDIVVKGNAQKARKNYEIVDNQGKAVSGEKGLQKANEKENELKEKVVQLAEHRLKKTAKENTEAVPAESTTSFTESTPLPTTTAMTPDQISTTPTEPTVPDKEQLVKAVDDTEFDLRLAA